MIGQCLAKSFMCSSFVEWTVCASVEKLREEKGCAIRMRAATATAEPSRGVSVSLSLGPCHVMTGVTEVFVSDYESYGGFCFYRDYKFLFRTFDLDAPSYHDYEFLFGTFDLTYLMPQRLTLRLPRDY